MKRKLQLLLVFSLLLVSRGPGEIRKDQLSRGISSESPVFQDRLLRAGNHILLDANYSMILDTVFYQVPIEEQGLWIKHPLNDVEFFPHIPGHPTNKIWLETNLGNEVGDPHFQEIAGTKYQNRTPFLQGLFYFAPGKNFSFFIGGNQNDHFSYTSISGRSALTQNGKQSWFGENLPPKSLVSGGFNFKMPNYSLDFSVHKGWQWTTSPYSGFSYPWKGYGTRTRAKFLSFFWLTHTSQDWKSFSDWDKQGAWKSRDWKPELVYQRLKKNLAWHISSYSGFTRWETSMEKTENAPAYLPDIENTKSDIHRSGIAIKLKNSFRDSLIMTDYTANLEVLDSDPVIRLEMSVEERPGTGILKQSIFAYSWNPLERPHNVREFWGTGPVQNTRYRSGSRSNGAGGILNYRTSGQYKFGFTLGGAGEWGLPVFFPDSVFSQRGHLYRTGELQNRDQPLYSIFPGVVFATEITQWAGFVSEIKTRKYLENKGEELELLPSEIQSHFRLKIVTLTDLQIHFALGYYSEKKLRGWLESGGDYIIPAHFEPNLSLQQFFKQNNVMLHMTALHMFGKEIVEHPNGNPMRFRIIAGGRASF